MENTLSIDTTSLLPHTWEQNWDIVTIVIPDCPKKDKQHVHITSKPDYIEIRYRDKVLAGKTQFTIYPAETTWYYTCGPEKVTEGSHADLKEQRVKNDRSTTSRAEGMTDTLYIELSKVDQHKWWRRLVEGIEEKEIPLEPRKKHEYPDYVQAMLDRKGEELRMAQTRPDLFNQG